MTGGRRKVNRRGGGKKEFEKTCDEVCCSEVGSESHCAGDCCDDVTEVSRGTLGRDTTRRRNGSTRYENEMKLRVVKESQVIRSSPDVTVTSGGCPCCDPNPDDVIGGFEFEHLRAFVDSELCVIDAMSRWKKLHDETAGAKLGASVQQHITTSTFHDERLCLKFGSCHQYRKDPCLPGLIDPTRYFVEESLGKLKDAELYARYGFDRDPSDDEALIDETESESESETTITKPHCRCCDPEPGQTGYTFQHLTFSCSETLNVRQAMTERTETIRSLGDPHTNRSHHRLVQSYHDERNCDKLATCSQYRHPASTRQIDPTRYFCEEKLGKVDEICDYYESIIGTEDTALQRYVLSETTPMFSSEVHHYGKFRTGNHDWVIVTRAPVRHALYHTDPKFKRQSGARSNDGIQKIKWEKKNDITALAGITYNLPALKINKPGQAVPKMAFDGSGVLDFCPCCDQNTLEFAPGLKYAHSQFTIPRDVDPRAALDAREAFMVRETIEVRRQFFPQRVRVTIHDERICANLPSCHEFKGENKRRSVDPTRYFTDLRQRCTGLNLRKISQPALEAKIDFKTLRCPCCERDHVHEELDHGFEHVQYHVPSDLSLHEAMLRRHRFTETYESPQRFYRPIQLNFHDERLCLKLDNCIQELCEEEDGYIDPTRYFTDKQLTKYQSMMLKELILNNGVQNECFEDENVSYRETIVEESEGDEGRIDVTADRLMSETTWLTTPSNNAD